VTDLSGINPKEQIEEEIQNMGYITVKPRIINPSYYKLKDRTVVKVVAHVNHFSPDPTAPAGAEGFAVNSVNLVNAFVPKENRNPALFSPYNPSEIPAGVIDDDMEPITLKEDFSVYELSNGFIVSVKSVVSQISKTKYYTPAGEPVYIVNSTPIVKVKKEK
jgi:hypothetical protein